MKELDNKHKEMYIKVKSDCSIKFTRGQKRVHMIMFLELYKEKSFVWFTGDASIVKLPLQSWLQLIVNVITKHNTTEKRSTASSIVGMWHHIISPSYPHDQDENTCASLSVPSVCVYMVSGLCVPVRQLSKINHSIRVCVCSCERPPISTCHTIVYPIQLIH